MGDRGKRREAQPHWTLLAFLLIVLLLFLVLSGFTSGQVGESADAPASKSGRGEVPSAILNGGPIVDPSRPQQPGLKVPDKHVVLTFDDGPTNWTAGILDVLDRHGVKGTFFVIGARVADRPDLLERMAEEGHEVGVHTFTHVNLANVSRWRLRFELDQTELAIAAATGHTTDLVRPPYSSRVDAIDASDWQALARARNYRVVFADLDTRDWERPGVAEIVAAGLPGADRGAVVMPLLSDREVVAAPGTVGATVEVRVTGVGLRDREPHGRHGPARQVLVRAAYRSHESLATFLVAEHEVGVLHPVRADVQ